MKVKVLVVSRVHVCVCVCVCVCVRLFVTPWDVVHQAPLSMEFSRQEYWSGCHSLLQGIFPTQGSNLGLLDYRQVLYHLSYQGSPKPRIRALEITQNIFPYKCGYKYKFLQIRNQTVHSLFFSFNNILHSFVLINLDLKRHSLPVVRPL